MHIASLHNRIAVALKSGAVKIYDAYTRNLITVLNGVQQVCSSLVVGEVVYFGAMKQVHLLECETLNQLSSIETTEWVFAMCMLDE